MDIDSTNIAAVDPERRTIRFTNRTTARGELVEPELMAFVDDMVELLGELGAKWVHIEVTAIASVEQALDAFTTNVTAPMVHTGQES